MKTLKLKQWYDCCQNYIYVKNVIDIVYNKEIAYFHLNYLLETIFCVWPYGSKPGFSAFNVFNWN